MTPRSMALTRQLLNRPLALSSHHADILSSMLLKGGDDVMLFGPPSDLEQFIVRQMTTRLMTLQSSRSVASCSQVAVMALAGGGAAQPFMTISAPRSISP